jgi:O-acetyl-ADP-ribose deacetylase (regulator of RNase III)
VVIPSCGRKSVMAATKHRIFDIALRAIGAGLEGYEKPNKAQTANTKNIAARENKQDDATWFPDMPKHLR